MKLFEETQLGSLKLKNRFVMAPMTRSRAINNLANDLIAEYYAQRATAGLIITEGISPSPNGLGYSRIPGLFNIEQAQSWRKVTDAVHAKGGRIFAQLMHTGRNSHPLNLPAGAKILAPSAIASKENLWTDQNGLQPLPVPNEMTTEEIEYTIQEFANSAHLAVNVAGFDGIELHGANGYLIDQFLNTKTNKRGDIYGKDRTEFAFRVTKAVSEKIGADKVGIRISPYGVFNDLEIFEKTDEFYTELVRRLSPLGIAYVHVIDHNQGNVKQMVRENFKGTYILSTGYDATRAEADLKENRGDLVAFGRAFISNPDYVERVRQGIPLQDADPSKFFTPGAEGFTDYPIITHSITTK